MNHSSLRYTETTKFRIAYSLLVVTPFVEMIVGAFMHHRGVTLWLPLGLIYAWMLGIFVMEGRSMALRQRAIRASWDDD